MSIFPQWPLRRQRASLGAFLRALRGAKCLSHPDPGYLGDDRRFAWYCGFLDAVAGRAHVWKALPRDIAAWWREPDAGGKVWEGSGTYGHAKCDVVSGEVTFEPPPTR